jgi:electron transport complex protein RnfG
MKINAKDILVPTVSLFIICLVATVLLALVNNITEPMIEKINDENAASLRLNVLPQSKEFKELNSGDISYYEGRDGSGKTVGYIFVTDGPDKGYGGTVTVMTGVDLSGKVTGIEMLTLNETPGLGMNAERDSFKSQFVGKSGVIGVSKTSRSDTEIQALTSATITSNAVTSAVNLALEHFKEISGSTTIKSISRIGGRTNG